MTIGSRWCTVTTLRENLDATLKFVAQHLTLGASEMFMFFDDPTDPALPILKGHPRVRSVTCDEEYWKLLGGRPKLHEHRIVRNANIAYRNTQCDWIIQIDADEMVHADETLSTILDDVRGNTLRLKPHEKMVSDGTQTTNQIFKSALPNNPKGENIAKRAYGEYARCLKGGMLSHRWGKFFTRTGLKNVTLGLHVPYMQNVPIESSKTKAARLLHFHGANFEEWATKIKIRIKEGAYQPRFQQQLIDAYGIEATLSGVLQSSYRTHGMDGLRKFHQSVCTFGPEKECLAESNALHRFVLDFDDEHRALLKS